MNESLLKCFDEIVSITNNIDKVTFYRLEVTECIVVNSYLHIKLFFRVSSVQLRSNWLAMKFCNHIQKETEESGENFDELL